MTFVRVTHLARENGEGKRDTPACAVLAMRPRLTNDIGNVTCLRCTAMLSVPGRIVPQAVAS